MMETMAKGSKKMTSHDETRPSDLSADVAKQAIASAQPGTNPTSANAAHFLEAHNSYFGRLNDGWAAAQEGLKGTSCKYNKAHEALRVEFEKSVTDAMGRYQKEARELRTGSPEQLQRAAVDAHQRYQTSVQTAYTEAAQKWEPLKEELQQALCKSQKSYAEHCSSAYKKYVASLKEAWQLVDVESMDAATLAYINRLADHAAHCASSTFSG
jgi:F0F1-type ATP synthase membrane subunit b/b'